MRSGHALPPSFHTHGTDRNLTISSSWVNGHATFCADGVLATELMLECGPRIRTFHDPDTPVTLDALESGHTVDYIGPRRLAGFDLVSIHTRGRALELIATTKA
jgi:hypothetical protein